MKRINIIVLLSCVSMLIACSNEETITNNVEQKQTLSVQERYAITKEIAVYHSQGLNFAYNKLKNARRTDDLVSPTMINTIVNEFVYQEKVHSDLQRFEKRISFQRTLNGALSIPFRSIDETEEQSIKICSFFKNATNMKISDVKSVETYIESIISSEEFASFSEVEQNELLAMLAVWDDSINYWKNNSDKWDELLNVNHSTALLRSPDNNTKTDDPVQKADAIGYLVGSIGGAITGGITGAITGAIAGGVGALPSALVGWATGAVAGGIGTAVSSSLAAHLINQEATGCGGYMVIQTVQGNELYSIYNN